VLNVDELIPVNEKNGHKGAFHMFVCE